MVLISGNPTTGYGSLMSNNCNNCTSEADKYNCSHRHTAQPSVTKEGQESDLYFPIRGHPRGYSVLLYDFLFLFFFIDSIWLSIWIQIKAILHSIFMSLVFMSIFNLFLWWFCFAFYRPFLNYSTIFFSFLYPLVWVFLWWFLR